MDCGNDALFSSWFTISKINPKEAIDIFKKDVLKTRKKIWVAK